jgi:carboxypeptidase C (cathepsin A)
LSDRNPHAEDPSTGDAPDKDEDARRRARVDRLLAAPAVRGEGRAPLAGRAQPLPYRVVAEFLPVADEDGEPEAAVMTTAYLAQGEGPGPGPDPATRPLCFVFNGGPGSSSIWLHLGALGPRRVPVHDDGTMPAAPYAAVDNPLSWLAHFDLVFIDPPHTGWSLTAGAKARKKMLCVDGDVAALTEVIRVWLARHARWGSPLYLAGESYGTTRGAAIADRLLDNGIALSGVILVSCAMDLQSISFEPRNDLPYALFLPAFANTAQYHGLLEGSLGASPEAARAAAEAFAGGEYLAALHAGARLDARTRARVAARIGELTGLPAALVEEKNLRISDQTFFFEALRPRGRIVGRLESRVTGPMAASRTRTWEFDPGIEAFSAPYTMAAMAYFAGLGLVREDRYAVIDMKVNEQWDWNRGKARGEGYACTSTDLARALRRNPHLRVFAASGRYDLGTPYSASDWSLAQLDAPPEVLARVTHRYYDAGHMMYTREADLRRLAADLAAWLGGRTD